MTHRRERLAASSQRGVAFVDALPWDAAGKVGKPTVWATYFDGRAGRGQAVAAAGPWGRLGGGRRPRPHIGPTRPRSCTHCSIAQDTAIPSFPIMVAPTQMRYSALRKPCRHFRPRSSKIRAQLPLLRHEEIKISGPRERGRRGRATLDRPLSCPDRRMKAATDQGRRRSSVSRPMLDQTSPSPSRRRSTAPQRPKPNSIVAQVVGSGITVLTEKLSNRL